MTSWLLMAPSLPSRCTFMKKLTKDHNLQRVNPVLAGQWHPTKNGSLMPRQVTPRATRKVWWVCEKGHEWQARIADRAFGNGCPFCHNKRKPRELIAAGKKPAFGKPFRKVMDMKNGKVLVEMPRKTYQTLSGLIMPPEDLGALIVSYREKNQLTQFEFAEIIGLHRNTVINLEQGQTKAIRMDQLKRIMTLVLG